MGEYSWHPPVAKQWQRVRYRDHKGGVFVGTVMRVETYYGFGDAGPARHIYGIRRDGRDRLVHVGDDAILGAVGEDRRDGDGE